MSSLGPHKLIRKARIKGGGGIDDPVETAPAATFSGCAVYPRGDGSESNDRALTVIAGYTALIPDVDADIVPADVLTWRSKDYEVLGQPGQWFYLDGQPAGLQVALQRVSG